MIMADRLPDNEIRDITKMLEAGKPQDDFESYVDSLKSFRELTQICKEYQ